MVFGGHAVVQLELVCGSTERSPYFKTFMEPRNRFQGMNSASLCSLAGRYDNPILPRFLAPIDCLKIPALESADSRIGGERGEGFHNRVQWILLFFRKLRKRTLWWVQNLNLSGKSAYHVFANNFFLLHFLKTFSTDLKSAFFYTHIKFLVKNCFFSLLSIFLNFECKFAWEVQKFGTPFFINVSKNLSR